VGVPNRRTPDAKTNRPAIRLPDTKTNRLAIRFDGYLHRGCDAAAAAPAVLICFGTSGRGDPGTTM